MSTHSLSLLAMTETHICPTDNDSFLHSITPAGFKLCHRLRSHSFGGGVGFFLLKISSSKFLKVLPIHPLKTLLLVLVLLLVLL